MTSLQRRLRYSYWFLVAFARKNARFIVISFIGCLFLVLFLMSFFPFASTFFSTKHEKIGLVGKYRVDEAPKQITSLISSPLVNIDDKGAIVPVLASSWEVMDDGNKYRFHLKKDLYWDDNSKFEVEDINYKLQGVIIVPKDSTTVDFELQNKLPIFPVYLSQPLIKDNLVGIAGAYSAKKVSTKNGIIEEVQLSPNSGKLPRKTFKFYKNDNDLVVAYKRGEINQFTTTSPSIAAQLEKWKNTKVDKQVDFGQIITLFFNMESNIFSSREARRTVIQSVPLSEKYGERAYSPIPPTSWAYSDNVRRFDYEPEQAKKDIEKNKETYKGKTINLYTFYEYIDMATEIKTALEAAGLTVSLKAPSFLPEEYDLLLTSWTPPSDPDQYFFWHSTQESSNFTNYKNVKIDKYLEDGRKTANPDERKKIYADFQKTLVEDLPAYFLYYPTVYTITRK